MVKNTLMGIKKAPSTNSAFNVNYNDRTLQI